MPEQQAAVPDDNAARPAHNLERDVVVWHALQLLDDAGFSGLTLRRLADSLGVKAAALYWHFENKQDLIDAMAETIIRQEFAHVSVSGQGWREVLTMVGATHRRALLRHRDGARLMVHANLRQSNLTHGREKFLQLLQAQGLSAELALDSVFAIIRYSLGCVFEEQAEPHLRHEHLFEQGLTIILDGIEHRLAKTPLDAPQYGDLR